MKWYQSKQYLDYTLKTCKNVALAYNSTLTTKEMPDFAGQACMSTRIITVNDVSGGNNQEQMTEQEFMSIFFHELAHIVNCDNKKFPVYHDPNNKYVDTPAYYRTAWRAELYTDTVGKKLMHEFFPGIEYLPAYKKEDREAFYWIIKGA
jgi:hypothetical protein